MIIYLLKSIDRVASFLIKKSSFFQVLFALLFGISLGFILEFSHQFKSGIIPEIVISIIGFFLIMLSLHFFSIKKKEHDLLNKGIEKLADISAELAENKRELAVKNELLRKRTKKYRNSSNKYKEKSLRDSLTGLYNDRDFLKEVLSKIFSSLKRHGEIVILIFIDIDDFGDWNTKYGHAIGDLVLKKVASALQTSFMRDEDIIFRYGGDEFLVIITLTNDDEIETIANLKKIRERINEEISRIEYPSELKKEKVSITCGFHLAESNNQDPLEELTKASLKMFELKKSKKAKQ